GVAYQSWNYGDNLQDVDSLGLTGTYSFGNSKLVASWANVEQADLEQDGWGLGLSHSLSKRTSVYATYASVDHGYRMDWGARASFSGINGAPTAGYDSRIGEGEVSEDGGMFSVGMIHDF
ncbi:porin, partial [Solemya elarraichensis gill symbiont]